MICLFQLDPKSVTVVLEDDGTVVECDTFFKQIPTQTVLVFLRKGETWGGGEAPNRRALIFTCLQCKSFENT